VQSSSEHSEVISHKIAPRLSSESEALKPIEIAAGFLGPTGSLQLN
jgi:hypothetical protein